MVNLTEALRALSCPCTGGCPTCWKRPPWQEPIITEVKLRSRIEKLTELPAITYRNRAERRKAASNKGR